MLKFQLINGKTVASMSQSVNPFMGIGICIIIFSAAACLLHIFASHLC